MLANPCLALSWQYLLRFLRFNPTPDAARWEELCRRHDPENYGLALLGTHLYPRPAALDRLREVILEHRPRLLPDERPAAGAQGQVEAGIADGKIERSPDQPNRTASIASPGPKPRATHGSGAS